MDIPERLRERARGGYAHDELDEAAADEIERLTERVEELEQSRHDIGEGLEIWAERAEAAENEIERLREALTEIARWAEAYPFDVFPEPDLSRAHALRASAMRHVLNGVAGIVISALRAPGREATL
jgi:DNA repair exonuclease SbcCD ATPase subunit